MNVSIPHAVTFSLLDETWCDEIVAIEQRSFSSPWSRNLILSEFFKPISFVLGAFALERLVGYAICNVVLDELHILTLAVAPEQRRTGVGTALIESSITEARGRGALRTFLEVRSKNSSARSLYRRAGFVEVAVRRGYYSDDGDDAIVLERVFSEPQTG